MPSFVLSPFHILTLLIVTTVLQGVGTVLYCVTIGGTIEEQRDVKTVQGSKGCKLELGFKPRQCGCRAVF